MKWNKENRKKTRDPCDPIQIRQAQEHACGCVKRNFKIPKKMCFYLLKKERERKKDVDESRKEYKKAIQNPQHMKQEPKICDFEKKEESKVKRLLQVFQKDRDKGSLLLRDS